MGAVGGGIGLAGLMVLGLITGLTEHWLWTEMWSNNVGHEIVGVIMFLVMLCVFFWAFVIAVIATLAVAVD